MRIHLIVALPLMLSSFPALAQGGGATPSADAHKLGGGGAEGDPRGAIRALSPSDDSGSVSKQIVKVPNLGGEEPGRTGGPPPGTSGPGAR